MRITNLRWGILLSGVVLILSACSSNASITPLSTRAATQTPWIIERVVTATPEPPTVTPLPTATESKPRTPTKAPTAKPAATAIKPTVVPVVAPSSTAVPACNLGSVTLLFPENGTLRRTKNTGPASDTFDFKWTPFQGGETDPQVGYRIEIQSRAKNGRVLTGDVVDVSHNWFINNGQHYIYDARRVYNLALPAGGDDVTVVWTVTIIKATGGFDNQTGRVSGGIIKCGNASAPSTIDLRVLEQ